MAHTKKERFKLELLSALEKNNTSRLELAYVGRRSRCGKQIRIDECELYLFLLRHWDLDKLDLREEFKVVLLKRDLRVIGIYTVSIGGRTSATVDVSLVIGMAILTSAEFLVLAHNHPGGNPRPSKADEKLTEQITKACQLFDIGVIDHIVISRYAYYSFLGNGCLKVAA
jgi:DNA repair protein RadC